MSWDIFISYSHKDKDWVHNWLAPRLGQAGVTVCTDSGSFDVGVPVMANIEAAILACRHILLVLTPAWLESEWTACEALMAQYRDPANLRQMILPVLREPCYPPARLGMLSYADLTGRGDTDKEFANLVAAIRGERRLPSTAPLKPSQESPPDLRSRHIMIDRVNHYWVDGLLKKSLHNTVLIELGMQRRSDAVEHPWHMSLRTGESEPSDLEEGTTIVDVFDTTGRALLILGAPGSGKTVTLLELVEAKIVCARDNSSEPIPVVFNLSSWSDGRRPLKDWLVGELKAKYYVPKRVASDWIENDHLLLLLDGLDEVRASDRLACVRAINQFRLEHGFVQIVVCARTPDYDTIGVRLDFDAAVLLKPLTREQVRDYTSKTGLAEHPLARIIDEDPTFARLAQSPLMLNILASVYADSASPHLPRPDSAQDLQEQLFSAYLNRMLSRVRADASYAKAKAIGWLAWLARRMQASSQSIFLLEGMPPLFI
jgi:hypothetical protein